MSEGSPEHRTAGMHSYERPQLVMAHRSTDTLACKLRKGSLHQTLTHPGYTHQALALERAVVFCRLDWAEWRHHRTPQYEAVGILTA